MPKNRGTEFQTIFKDLCKNSGIDCIRLYDTLQGYSHIDNPCDFIISKDKSSPMLLIECKSTHSKSFNLSFRQLEKLLELKNCNSYVVIWFITEKQLWALPIHSIQCMIEAGKKSFSPYKICHPGIFQIPATFARIKPKSAEVLSLWNNLITII